MRTLLATLLAASMVFSTGVLSAEKRNQVGATGATVGADKPNPGKPVKGKNPGVSALTTSDCRILGGTVITPGDDRCGKLGTPYCRFPDTMAMCITEGLAQ